MSEVTSSPVISTTNDLTIFVSVIAAIFGSSIIFFVGFFIMEHMGWLNFPSTASLRRKEQQIMMQMKLKYEESSTSASSPSTNEKKNIPGLTWMYKDLETFPRAKLMGSTANALNTAGVGPMKPDHEAVGYVNQLFSDILQETDDEEIPPKRNPITVSADINTTVKHEIDENDAKGKKLKGLSILPSTAANGRDATQLTSFKPSTSLQVEQAKPAQRRPSSRYMDATLL